MGRNWLTYKKMKLYINYDIHAIKCYSMATVITTTGATTTGATTTSATTTGATIIKKKIIVKRISINEYEKFVANLDLLKLGWSSTNVSTIDFARELVSLTPIQSPDMKMCFDKYMYLLKHNPSHITTNLRQLFGTTVYPLRLIGMTYVSFKTNETQFIELYTSCSSNVVRRILVDVIQSYYNYMYKRSSFDFIDDIPLNLTEPTIDISDLETLDDYSQLISAANKLLMIGRNVANELQSLSIEDAIEQKMIHTKT